MNRYLPLLRIMLDNFAAISFTLMSVLCMRDRKQQHTLWGGTVYLWTAVDCTVHFLYRSMRFLAAGPLAGLLGLLDAWALLLLPALLFHLIYKSEQGHMRCRALWKGCIATFYAIAVVGTGIAAMALRVPFPQFNESFRKFAIVLLGVAASTACALVLSSRNASPSRLEYRQRRWVLFLCSVLAVVSFARMLAEPLWLLVLQDMVPLGFIFVVTYWVERFTFFDVLIKKGALAFCALFALTAYFVWVAPFLLRRNAGIAFPLTIWPIVLAYPWFNRRICAWLDRVCLGRRFSPAAAAKHFLSGLQGSVSEVELVGRAQILLAEIFQAESVVTLSSAAAPVEEGDAEYVHVPVNLDGKPAAQISLRARGPRARILSEDRALLASLADSLAFLLENLRLRDKRLEQEKRVQELELNANRLELKALRAQINPHFLFNALNTIAGLIPRHPARAEQTIEQLAEVFHFTLRRMDREWVRLEEEIEAVRAYLDVEQARFGDRLRFHIDLAVETGRTRIPAMIVQTLVENAVKHGISVQAAPGTIEVAATLTDERISIEVRDTGPGFGAAARVSKEEGGHGLRNIRDRLRGYFGDHAELRTGRDSVRGMTLAAVEMPRVGAAVEVAVR